MAKTKMPAQLVSYWTKGPGAAKIGWGKPGDFGRCRTAINAEIVEDGGTPLPPNVINGLCATLHKKATGATPGNAPGEKRGK